MNLPLADPSGGIAAAIAELQGRFGDRLSTSGAVRDQHGKDVAGHPGHPPDAVVFAESAEEVAEIAAVCHRHRAPLIPFGTGTSCEGHIAALHGGISLDLGRMNRILEIRPEDMVARVEPGLTRKALNAALRDTGLFFSVDPGADASLGGMASTRASGTTAMRYGTMKDNVLALGVVLANGERIRTGSGARKSSVGYDLTRLMIGAEGTLGIITELTVRLHPVPERIAAVTCSFPSLPAAVDFVILATSLTATLARIELLDQAQIAAVNRYSALGLPERPALFLELHGSAAAVAEALEMLSDEARAAGAGGIETAERPEDRSRLWQARHDIWWANLALRPGASALPTDSCVPVSRLAEAIEGAQQDVRALGLEAPLCGHVGDGNFHLCVLFDPEDADERHRVEELCARLARRAIALGGTASGEHGVGHGKIAAARAEHGAALRAMAAIKRALDPRNILNPGKIFDLTESAPYR